MVNAALKTLVMIPTYNERDNLEWIVARVRAAEPGVDVLVVDDASPDGTGEAADEPGGRGLGIEAYSHADEPTPCPSRVGSGSSRRPFWPTCNFHRMI